MRARAAPIPCRTRRDGARISITKVAAMPRASLPPNRNNQPLTEAQVDRMFLTFRHLDPQVPVRYVPNRRTCFVVREDGEGNEVGEICFGADIHPGAAILDPNSIMSPKAAAAHEIAHYHRWADGTEIAQGNMDNIDEALTSLFAVLRFQDKLESLESRQLISDAIARLQMHVLGQLPEQVDLEHDVGAADPAPE